MFSLNQLSRLSLQITLQQIFSFSPQISGKFLKDVFWTLICCNLCPFSKVMSKKIYHWIIFWGLLFQVAVIFQGSCNRSQNDCDFNNKSWKVRKTYVNNTNFAKTKNDDLLLWRNTKHRLSYSFSVKFYLNKNTGSFVV